MERQRLRPKVLKTEAADASPPATRIDDVPDDLLERILLRLDSPVWLIRAASTCKRWRGIIADDGGVFLRRACSLHPPTIVGHYHLRGQYPPPIEFIPTSSPPPDMPIDTSCFSLDFLFPPDVDEITSKLEVIDCHGGLVLLQSFYLKYLVVCDPLTRRYTRVNGTAAQLIGASFYLIDGEDGTVSASNFRVFRTVLYRKYGEPWSCVFSTAADGDCWSTLPPSNDELEMEDLVDFAGRVDGSLYLGTVCGSVMFLDNASLELNKVHLPSRVNALGLRTPSAFCVVEHCAAGDGDSTSPPAPRIVHVKGDEIEVFRRVHGTGGEWVLENSVSRLPEVFGIPSHPMNYNWVRKVIVSGVGLVVVLPHGSGRWAFSLCLETMEVKLAPAPELTCYHGTTDAFIYTLPWPPLIRACKS